MPYPLPFSLLTILLTIIALTYNPLSIHDHIYSIFKFLTSAPINFWFYLIFIPAALTFFIPPAKAQRRGMAMLVVIGVTYVFMNLSLGNSRTIEWRAYEACQETRESPAIDTCAHLVNIADGASNIFYLILGWVPAMAYAALWEVAWRRKHKQIVKEGYPDRWFGTTIIRCSYPVWGYAVFLVILIAFSLLWELL